MSAPPNRMRGEAPREANRGAAAEKGDAAPDLLAHRLLKLGQVEGPVLVAELAHDLAVHHHTLFKATGEGGRAGRGQRDCMGEIAELAHDLAVHHHPLFKAGRRKGAVRAHCRAGSRSCRPPPPAARSRG